uniref:Putative ovule protein n=1 Tax=Solanum chacoense TaxID=4108 RepID=A0A0V0I4P2_SOLCH
MACGSHIADNPKENAKTRSSIPGKGGQRITKNANQYVGMNEYLCVFTVSYAFLTRYIVLYLSQFMWHFVKQFKSLKLRICA